ncbi:MAG: hypothetical protein JXA66_06345 [Oligoflexia bacterium]|nr:hypothetical protein [Oligoflexia bacterium]
MDMIKNIAGKRGQVTVEYILLLVLIAAVIFGLARYLTDYSDKKLSAVKADWRDKLAGVKDGQNLALARRDFYTKPVDIGELDRAGGAQRKQYEDRSRPDQEEKDITLAQAEEGPEGKRRRAAGREGEGSGTGSGRLEKTRTGEGAGGRGRSTEDKEYGEEGSRVGSTGFTKSSKSGRAGARDETTQGVGRTGISETTLQASPEEGLSEEEKERRKLVKKLEMEDDMAARNTDPGAFGDWNFWKFLIVLGAIFFFVFVLIRSRRKK